MKTKSTDDHLQLKNASDALHRLYAESRPALGPGWLKPWQAYVFATMVVAATLALRLALEGTLDGQQTLVIFTMPIMLSAYVGGLRAGLLATGLSCFAASYYLLPSLHSFAIASTAERWQQFFIVLAGVFISVLNEALHRARRRTGVAIRERQAAEHDRERFFAFSQDALCIRGFDGYFKDVNLAWEKTLGYTKAELLARPFIEFVHPDDRVATLAEAEKVSGGQTRNAFENRYRCKDGSYRWFQWSVTPAIDNGIRYGIARDITERREAEASLRDSEQKMRIVIDGLGPNTFLGLMTPDGTLIEANRSGLVAAGLRPADVLGKPFDQTYWWSHSEPVREQLRAAMARAAAGEPSRYNIQIRVAEGSLVWADFSLNPVRDISGRVVYIVPSASVIDERVRAEEALLQAGPLQRAIFNSANFSSIATDAKGVIQIFNVGAERMLGFTAAEVMNKITPADISDPQEVIARATALSIELGTTITPGFEALVFKASRGIEDIYELTYIRKDGSRFPAIVSVTALRDDRGKIIGYLLIGTDNTARKQAEAALIKAGALQSAIFNSANFSSIATDAKGVIQIFNVGAERMLGYTAAEVMNKITPADISDPQEVIARATALSVELGTTITPGFEALVFKASRGIEDIYELTYIRKDGSRFPAVVSVTALRDAQDTIIGYLLIGTDNTARKRAEEALLKAGALQSAIFNSANFSSIATDAKGRTPRASSRSSMSAPNGCWAIRPPG